MSAAPQRPGLDVRCHRHAVASTVAVRVWLRGGQLHESSPGLALACGRLLTEGTSGRSWEQIVEASERLGMDVSAFGGPEFIGLAVDALAVDWREALETASELVLDPIFPTARCDWVRQQTMAELESMSEQPEVRTAHAFLRQLYGDHPWGRPLQGTVDGLAAVETVACAEFHRISLERGVIVSVAGDVDPEEVGALIARRFSGIGGSALEPPPLAHPPHRAAARQEVTLPDADQVQVLAGHLTVPVGHPDFVALQVVSVILGTGPGLVGRIPDRVRERDGLAYSASAAAVSGAGSVPGRLVVHVGTAPNRVDEVLSAVREELERLLSDGIGSDEVEEARQFLLGSEPFRRETARQLAALQAQAALFGVPFDQAGWLAHELKGLGRTDIEAAIRRHIDPKRLMVTLGLPSSI